MSSLTFRNVALSLVTMDGFTLMLSCMIDVKLSREISGKKLFTVVSPRADARLSTLPVNQLPSERKVPHDVHGDKHLLLNVDGSDHLVQELASVGQKLTHLQV